ncbi:hypothetical protein [Cytophaga aurantiaca]|uniref:hypothetical protein n=1 Tax=Cytophaga aurantiaca TaxID=29530 RepID=UPI0003745251|nr:hypothetical protein [Cytophaga aurantiaca]
MKRDIIQGGIGTIKIFVILAVISIVVWLPISLTYSADGTFVLGLPVPFLSVTSAKCGDCDNNGFKVLFFLIDIVFSFGIYWIIKRYSKKK